MERSHGSRPSTWHSTLWDTLAQAWFPGDHGGVGVRRRFGKFRGIGNVASDELLEGLDEIEERDHPIGWAQRLDVGGHGLAPALHLPVC